MAGAAEPGAGRDVGAVVVEAAVAAHAVGDQRLGEVVVHEQLGLGELHLLGRHRRPSPSVRASAAVGATGRPGLPRGGPSVNSCVYTWQRADRRARIGRWPADEPTGRAAMTTPARRPERPRRPPSPHGLRAGAAPAASCCSRADRQAQLLRAAATAFARAGFAATSMDDVAAEAGVTKLIVYRNFDSKEDLYRSVLDGVSDRLRDEWLREMDQPEADAPRRSRRGPCCASPARTPTASGSGGARRPRTAVRRAGRGLRRPLAPGGRRAHRRHDPGPRAQGVGRPGDRRVPHLRGARLAGRTATRPATTSSSSGPPGACSPCSCPGPTPARSTTASGPVRRGSLTHPRRRLTPSGARCGWSRNRKLRRHGAHRRRRPVPTRRPRRHRHRCVERPGGAVRPRAPRRRRQRGHRGPAHRSPARAGRRPRRRARRRLRRRPTTRTCALAHRPDASTPSGASTCS